MTEDEDSHVIRPQSHGAIPFHRPRRRRRGRGDGDGEGPRRPRVRKLRLLSILTGLGLLAVISTVFGMLMAVASDLPLIENRAEYHHAANSFLYDDHWKPIGIFSPTNGEVLDTYEQLGSTMRAAIVSVEDKRFWSDPGIDVRGIARALVADVSGKSVQGASTIAQQFVKNALSQEGNRTVFEKLREAALAYHLTRKWPRVKILTEYLNAIYFGNGAYGAESAARVYFGKAHGYVPGSTSPGGCGDSTPTIHRPSCASQLDAAQAALLAGMVANPSAFNPIAFPTAAQGRRNLVLYDMYTQRKITRAQYEQGRNAPLPKAADIEQPEEPPAAPYFTSWLRPQVLSAVGLGHGVSPPVAEYRAYYGGLRIRTTIDLPMQQAAQQAISANLPSGTGWPTASLVAIDNRTGEVRAMVGGPLVNGQPNFAQYPFNLATEGLRQPGSAFKPFTLAVALEHGYGPSSVFDSHPLDLIVPHSRGREHFYVHNFGNTYAGSTTLAAATADSDNSVFTQLGLSPGVGTQRIRRMAQAMGIRTPVSTNYAMIIGGLQVGVSPLDMAHAYATIADGGRRAYNPQLGSQEKGPTGIAEIWCGEVRCDGRSRLVDHPHYKRVIPASVAADIHSLLQGVVTSGTGTSAAISGVDVVGKTGTTSNYGDAWFVGWTPQITTAIWVGFPNKLIPMLNLYRGGPVEGGTFPADIWHTFMVQALALYNSEGDGGRGPRSGSAGSATTSATATTTAGGATSATTAPSTGQGAGAAPGGGTAGAPGAPAGATGAGTGAGTGAPAGGGPGAPTGSPSGAPTGSGTGAPTGAGAGGGGSSGGGNGGAGLGGGG